MSVSRSKENLGVYGCRESGAYNYSMTGTCSGCLKILKKKKKTKWSLIRRGQGSVWEQDFHINIYGAALQLWQGCCACAWVVSGGLPADIWNKHHDYLPEQHPKESWWTRSCWEKFSTQGTAFISSPHVTVMRREEACKRSSITESRPGWGEGLNQRRNEGCPRTKTGVWVGRWDSRGRETWGRLVVMRTEEKELM